MNEETKNHLAKLFGEQVNQLIVNFCNVYNCHLTVELSLVIKDDKDECN